MTSSKSPAQTYGGIQVVDDSAFQSREDDSNACATPVDSRVDTLAGDTTSPSHTSQLHGGNQNDFTAPVNLQAGFPGTSYSDRSELPLNSLRSRTQHHRSAMSTELASLDYLTFQPSTINSLCSTPQPDIGARCYPEDNAMLYNPGPIFEVSHLSTSLNHPDAVYQDLHTTLYNHMVETAQNTALTRQASPVLGQSTLKETNTVHEVPLVSQSPNSGRAGLGSSTRSHNPLKPLKLAQRRQLELWRNYIDEVAVWLDMFDHDRHFQFTIPLLAKTADHLHYSILALSARQSERKRADESYAESLPLYQEAIRLIVKELYTLDTTVIASCVLLCVLEMMSSSPRAWCRHLDGCAMLLEAAGVNGVVGGVGQSVFWCFARMDVWGGYLEDTFTKIPTSRWYIPSGSMKEAVTHFKTNSSCHSYANYAVFLCASVVNVISAQTSGGEPVERTTYLARWNALFDLLEDWYTNRLEKMQPLIAYPADSSDARHPFPILLYSSAPAVNGNQLYHAATMLMLQHKPRGIALARSPKSILWHARQICGIAISNSDHGASINGLQPLWIAGKIMSHETEHQAILDVLTRIEKDTGWATAWRSDDLKDYWGDVQDS